MYGITINDVHTFNDLGLLMQPFTTEVIEPKIYTIDIPGANGVLDITEVFGDVKYNDYVQEFMFEISQTNAEYEILRSQILKLFNGKQVKVVYDDDVDYYRLGRMTAVVSYDGMAITNVILTATFKPYKYKIEMSEQDLESGNNIVVNSQMNSTPMWVTQTEGISVQVNEGNIYGLNVGENAISDIFFKEGNNLVTVTGATGELVVKWQEGVL